MKRKILVISFMLMVVGAFSLTAQNQFQKEWNLGASFGVNLSQASFATTDRNEPFRTKLWQQYQGGLAVRFITEKHLGLIAEINYSQQGWSQDFDDKDKSPEERAYLKGLEHSHQLNYLEIPFLTHIYFGNKVRFYFNVGPKIGILLSENETFNDKLLSHIASGDLHEEEETAQYFRKADRKLDYGIVAGLGLEFRTGIGHFSLEGRYTFGLADFYRNKKSDPFQRSANRVIGVKLNYFVKVF